MAQQEQPAQTGRNLDDGDGQVDYRRTVHDGMLKSVTIRNFRVFDELSIDSLSRVNLIAGRNNAGKTSLLEALFLLSGGGNPEMGVNSNVIRGPVLSVPVLSVPVLPKMFRETYWKPLFAGLDTDKVVQIVGVHAVRGPLDLHISVERPTDAEFPIDGPRELSTQDLQGEPSLLLLFKGSTEPEVEGRVRVVGQGIQTKQSAASVPFDAVILSTRIGNDQEDATRLGWLRKQKQSARVLSALQTIEPRLQSIEDISASGIPMIWGDIGLPELVPLAVMGEGMTRLARLVLAIATVPGGLVLVDEIETGLHHTVLPDVWRAVDQAARQFDAQIVATTHSYECIRAAHKALGDGDGFLLHRLEASDKGNRCVTYSPESIDAAMRHELEVR